MGDFLTKNKWLERNTRGRVSPVSPGPSWGSQGGRSSSASEETEVRGGSGAGPRRPLLAHVGPRPSWRALRWAGPLFPGMPCVFAVFWTSCLGFNVYAKLYEAIHNYSENTYLHAHVITLCCLLIYRWWMMSCAYVFHSITITMLFFQFLESPTHLLL